MRLKERDGVRVVFKCNTDRLSEDLISGAAMVQSLLEKGESGSALALLEVHPISTRDPESVFHKLDLCRCRQEGEEGGNFCAILM